MKSFTQLLLLLVLLFTAVTTQAESEPVEFSGHVKNLTLISESVFTGESITSTINRLRLEVQKEINPWTFYVALDNEFIGNDFSNTPDFEFIRSREQKNTSSWDADVTSVDNDHVYLRHALFRAYAKYYSPNLQVTLGKQGIDWGVMRFYSPNDIFNTVGPIDLEREERVGVDAININYSTDSLSGLNVVVVPTNKDEDFMAALKLYKTFNTYDISIIASTVRKNIIAGITFDGYIKSAGFRGELNHTQLDNNRNFFRASAGIDYSVSEKIYILVEQFYNGGVDDDLLQAFSTDFRTSRELLSIKRNLSSIWLQYKITPIWEFNNFLIYDWDGKSTIYNPEMKYGITENIDVMVGAQIGYGGDNSEFGELPDLYYIQLQWFF